MYTDPLGPPHGLKHYSEKRVTVLNTVEEEGIVPTLPSGSDLAG